MDTFWALLVIPFLALVYNYLKNSRKLPPGPYGLPVLGFLPFIDEKNPHLTLTELSKKYGPIYSIKMGDVFTVVLSNQKLIREAFAKDALSGRAPLYLTHGLMGGKGLICAEGSLWKDQRKLVTSWLKDFGMSKHGINRENLGARILTVVDEGLKDISGKKNKSVDINHKLADMIGNIVNDVVFGYKFPEGDYTWEWLKYVQEMGCDEMGIAGIVNFLPFVRFFSKSLNETMGILVRGQKQSHRVYSSIIARRRETLRLNPPPGCEYPGFTDILKENPKGLIKCIKYAKNSKNTESHFFDPSTLIPCEGDCIIDNFLREQSKRFLDKTDSAKFVTDEQLLYLLADLFGAGLDTSKTTLEWFFLFMALNPDVQDWVREEINERKKFGDDFESTELTRLFAAICETQRIRSVVPVGIPHGCVQDTELMGYVIPKGAMVIPLQWAIHMDLKIWKDPETFNPKRFLAPDGSVLKPVDFIPFQTGKRMCPGDELARMILSAVAARVLRDFKLRLASKPPTDQELGGKVGITLVPPHVLYYFEQL